MHKLDINKAQTPLPGLHEQATTGKGKPIANTEQSITPPQTPKKRESRRVKVPDDIDTDYAEEAEDFFYGEGM